LHWQLSKWLNGLSLGTKVILISTFAHLCVLFCLFVVYQGGVAYHVTITSTMIDTNATIVFVPLYKSIKQNQSTSNARESVQKTQVASVAQATSRPESTARTTLAESVAVKKTKQKNKKAAKKDKKQITQKKQQAKATENKNSKNEIHAKEKVIEQVPALVSSIADKQTDACETTDTIVYVGQQEMEALQIQEYIQQEMAQHWSPPAGMRKDLICIIKLVFSFDGSLADLSIEKPSGVLIFDGAARKAAAQLQPPQWAYGKELLITFKP
jgi:outer membrane biosynthesis protein TonB